MALEHDGPRRGDAGGRQPVYVRAYMRVCVCGVDWLVGWSGPNRSRHASASKQSSIQQPRPPAKKHHTYTPRRRLPLSPLEVAHLLLRPELDHLARVTPAVPVPEAELPCVIYV